jgi:hypothetical protein
MVVDVETQGELVLGKPRLLFENELESFDVAPDGQRFVMVEKRALRRGPTHLVLVQNFGEELKRLVPAN